MINKKNYYRYRMSHKEIEQFALVYLVARLTDLMTALTFRHDEFDSFIIKDMQDMKNI